MLFLTRMDVTFPPHLPPEEVRSLQEQEQKYSRSLQEDGRLASIWRVVGEYANYSVFDVASNDELHGLLSGFPMYPYMRIRVTPLARHPNAIR